MKTVFLILISFCSYGQSNNVKITESRSDSLLNRYISPELKNHISKMGIQKTENLSWDTTGLTSENIWVVTYRLKNNSNEFYRIRETKSGFGLAQIEVQFDSNFVLKAFPNFHKYEVIDKRMFAPQIISLNKALELSNPFFKKAKRKSIHNYLIYDINKDIISWEINKFKGLRKCIEEKVAINAETGEFLSSEVYDPILNSFGQIVEIIVLGH